MIQAAFQTDNPQNHPQGYILQERNHKESRESGRKNLQFMKNRQNSSVTGRRKGRGQYRRRLNLLGKEQRVIPRSCHIPLQDASNLKAGWRK